METEADPDRDRDPDPKRLKSSHRPKPPPRRSISLTQTNSGEKPRQSSTLVHPELHKRRIEEAKRFAVAQAQQDGCTGNYRTFDSQFGNFLVPTIPTRAQLGE